MARLLEREGVFCCGCSQSFGSEVGRLTDLQLLELDFMLCAVSGLPSEEWAFVIVFCLSEG